jgi:hypothetical protein
LVSSHVFAFLQVLQGGYGYNSVIKSSKKGKTVKKEKITETKFVAYSPAKFYFYYSSKSRKNVKG